MKTFTTCAEKKAKQILNLLQGYTKGIRLTAILILLLMGVGNAWADYTWYSGDLLYYDFSAVSGGVNWHDGSNLQYDGSGGGKVKKVEFSSTVNMNNTWVVAKTNKGGWSEIKFSNPPSANQRRFIINSDGKTASWGYLDKYIAGDNWGGIGSWSTTTKKMTNNNNGTYTINFTSITASAHEFKIVNYDTWTGAIGHSNNVSCVNGKLENSGGNIKFTPYIAGNVTITHNVSTGKTVITCPGIPVTLDQQSGTGGTTSVTATYGAAMPTATMPTRIGYTFNGYFTATSGGTKYYNADGSSAKNWDKNTATTLYAQWTAKQYTITYKDQGGSNFSGTHESGYPTTHTYGTATTLKTASKTGYTFEGWYKESACTNTNKVTSLGATEYTANITLYAKWTANKYTVKFDANGGTGSMSNQSHTYGDSKALTANAFTRTGYTFAGWNTKADGTGTSYTDKQSVSNLSSTDGGSVTLYAQWTAKDITINWNANGGSVTPTSSTYTYDGDAITLPTPSYAGHRFLGWFTAANGGTQITNVGTTNKPYTTVTYYAHWEVSIVEHTVTFAVGTGSTEYGTLTAATNSGNITSGSNIVEGTSVTFTATPKTGYEVEGWYTNAACTEDKHDAGSTTYTTSITGVTNVYVKFVEKKWSVAFAAGTGGAVTTPSSTPQTVGEVTGISIVANPSTGYSFANWTSSNGGSFGSTTNASTTFKPTAATTVTANFSEIKHTVQVGIAAGQESWGSVSPHSVSVGQHTASGNITATAQTSVGYVFDHWEISDGITITSGDANSATIQIKATKDGSLTAHFRGENRLQDVYLIGTMNNWKESDAEWRFYKLPGESGNTVTLTKTINKSDFHNDGYKFGINIYHSNWGDRWWKNSSSNDTKMDAHNCTSWGFNTKDGDKRTYIDLNVSGEYTFTLADANDSQKQKLSITYPDKSFIEGDFSTAWDEDAYPLIEYGDIQTVTIPITSKKDVQFRLVSHGKLFGTSTKILVASNSQTLSAKNMESNGAVMTLGAYVEGDYTFSYNKSTQVLTVEYPSVSQLQIYSADPAHDAVKKNWDWDSQNGDIYTKKLSLNANTDYTFKAVINSAFYGKTTTLTRVSSSATLNTSGGNVTLSTDIAGDYIFTFNASNNQLAVTYPEYTMVPIYLNLSEFTNWENDNASFKIKYDNTTTTFTQIGCSHYYTCEAPRGKEISIFRTDGISEWNTITTIVPTNANNCFKVTGWTTGSWSTYTEPTHDITINAPESGTITVTIDGNTTTVTNEATTIEDVALNAQMTVAFTPATGYELGKAIIQIGNNEKASAAGTYTVCGPTEITAYFVTEEDQVVYLRPTDAWLADNARFAAYAFNRYAGTDAARWIELTTKDTDYTGAFSGIIPAGFSHVQFVRMPETGDFSFAIDLAQTLNYSIPTDGINNRFILGSQITSGSDKDNYQGSWEQSNTPIWSIPGDWTGDKQWTAENATPLYGPNGNATLALQASITTEFKLYQFPYGTQERQWYGNSETLVRGNSADKEFTTGTDNCKLTTDIAGDYVFSFNIRNKKLTVQYPELPVPNDITVTSRRLYDNTELDWFEGDGTEANPYKLYNDETIRLTVSPLTEVAGLTAYYKVGDNEEQTSNIFDWEETMSEPTKTTIQAYYKNATGTSTETVSVETPYYIHISLPFYLMTAPSGEINIDRVAAGENILVQFRSDAAASVGLYVKIGNGEEQKLTDITSTISTDYTHDVDNNIAPCVLHYIARSTEAVNNRTFEATVDVVIYKNVIIKVHDPEGWVKNAYMWRDYSDAVLTQWPGDPVLQNFGTWRIFSVKYPYYDRFIVNDGQAEGATQTIDYVLPADDTCYELLTPANNGSSDPADTGKYGLQVADCPGNLMVNNIKDTTLMEGEQIVVMPEVFVGLGYKLSDVEITHLNADNPSSVRVMQSGNNIIVSGYGIGSSNVTVSFTLGTETITKTFTVTVVKNTHITIQVKVPVNFGDGNDYQWKDGTKIGIRYWGTGINGTDLTMDYAYTDATYHYAQAQLPLGTDDKINFHFYYERHSDEYAKWRQSSNVTATVSGCYKLAQGSDYYRSATRDGDYCFDDTNYAQYQVKIFLPTAGKQYSSNIVTNTTDILSFFAPGQNETGYRAGTVQLYKNGKMVAAINPTMFAESNVYTATVNETGDGLDNVSTYSGNFYIRTYGTSYKNVGFNNGKGWNSIKDLTAVEKDSVRFTKFTSREGEFYNHYWVQAMNTGSYDGKDVSACVANDYNDDLAGKLLQDKHTDEKGDIKVDGTGKVINVRFGYDPRTNYFGRAILQGSEYDTYLNLHCNNAYRDKDCTKQFPYGNSNVNNKMYDISNWVYQRDFYVPITNNKPSASLYIEATSPNNTTTVIDHLLGYVTNEITGEATTTPIQKTIIGSGTTNGTYLIRVVYDFKTNRLIAAWLPQGTVDVKEDRTLNADVLFVRKENETVPQVQLAENGKIRSLETMYFALELERGDANKANRHEEQYFFTLPFNSLVGSISGVPGYMQTWGIQRYRGDLRAKHGLYLETPTYWQWLSTTDTLYAGEGYLLVFDKKAAPFEEIEVDKMDSEGNIIDGQKEKISMMRLYFASDVIGFDMQPQSELQRKDTFPDHTCTLTLHDRYKYDSNWKVIGTNSYSNAGVKSAEKDNEVYVDKYEERIGFPSFRYEYSYTMSNDNRTFTYKYTPEDGKSTYKSFFGYMVQFAGIIEWQPVMSETVPEGIAARRYVAEGEHTSYTTRLELANAIGEKQDQTFVALDENATTGFDQNKDLNKVINQGTNIYTLAENVPYAGNTLAMEKQTVPVGIVVAEAGEYTFRMPDGTDGISVFLIDNQTGVQTNMLLDEYTVTLDAGTFENRFYLAVDPDRTATSVENIGEGAKGEEAKDQIKKFLIDGKLFIRTADGIFDAKGQRL